MQVKKRDQKCFKHIFVIELKRLKSKLNIVLLSILVIILFLSIYDGKMQNDNVQENEKIFQKSELMRISKYILYTQYAGYGFRIMFIPNPLSIFFNGSNVTNCLLSNIDTTERLTIVNVAKGRNAFVDGLLDSFDFSVIVLVFGSLLVILYGFGTLRNRHYLKFLSTVVMKKNIFPSVIISRLLILNGLLLLLFLLSFIWAISIGCDVLNYLHFFYLLKSLYLTTFFFLAGLFIGSLLKKSTALFTLISFYLISVFLFPLMVNKIVGVRAQHIRSIFHLELENLELMMNFERQFFEKFGIYKSGNEAPEEVKTLILNAIKSEFEKFKQNEKMLILDTLENVNLYHDVLSILPTGSYISTIKEIGGEGYYSFLAFWEHALDLKYEFINFYLHKKYFTVTKPGEIEPLLKEANQYSFQSKGIIPGSFIQGIIITSFYIILLIIFSYKRFKKLIVGQPGKLRDLDIDIKLGKLNYLLTGDQGLKNQVFNFFRGKGKTFVNISLNGKPLERKEFVYLFDTTNFPEEITPGNLHKFLFGEKLIDDRPRWEIIFEYAVSQGKNGRVVFMDEFFNGLSPEEIKQIKGAIELNGLKSLYISNNYDQALNVADEVIMAHPEDKTIGINSSM